MAVTWVSRLEGMTSIDAGPTGRFRLAPSILAADFGSLAEQVRTIDD